MERWHRAQCFRYSRFHYGLQPDYPSLRSWPWSVVQSKCRRQPFWCRCGGLVRPDWNRNRWCLRLRPLLRQRHYPERRRIVLWGWSPKQKPRSRQKRRTKPCSTKVSSLVLLYLLTQRQKQIVRPSFLLPWWIFNRNVTKCNRKLSTYGQPQ